tara:strand:- start:41 stop:892 length:852 start_codon:yes stop_codon:yes gene_type:complete
MNLINQISRLPTVKSIIKENELRPLKKLGQNFIFDLNVTNNIAKVANCHNKNIIEIGPGPGGLTRSIFIQGANSIIAIEKDYKSIKCLQSLQDICGDKLKIIHDDILNLKLIDFGPFPKSIIANLPYNISSKLIINWLKEINLNKDVLIDEITITIQKELADKLVSKVGDSNYGRISLITNLLSNVSKEIELPPSVFFPKPKVHSSVVKIIPLTEPRFDVDLDIFEKLTRRAFGNRRKMLRQSLKDFGGSNLLKLANIKDDLRAQDLSTSEFCRLSKLFAKNN